MHLWLREVVGWVLILLGIYVFFRAFLLLTAGNQFMLDNRRIEALAEFSAALDLDSSNEFAQQRLRDALAESNPEKIKSLRIVSEAGELGAACSALVRIGLGRLHRFFWRVLLHLAGGRRCETHGPRPKSATGFRKVA